ncbi:hypothetical protein [Pseudoalteromonas sp. MMG012]|jgi:hypothetical protein|nr:hypothetical protein [Pseudoalteromonas sp. MMG012]
MIELKAEQLKKIQGGMNSGSPDLPARQQVQQIPLPIPYNGGD